AQDRQAAETREVRATKRMLDLDSGAVSVRIIREQMVEDGDLTRSQFERLELMDGRLADGISVLALFFSRDKEIIRHLDIGVTDPLDTESNDIEAIKTIIHEKVSELNAFLINEPNSDKRRLAFQSLMALIHLERHYDNPASSTEIMLGNIDSNLASEKPDTRVRTGDGSTPGKSEGEQQSRAGKISRDDRAEVD
ncbi:hypothetical protein LCGC14_2397220, partial [marine sediment metagenome]